MRKLTLLLFLVSLVCAPVWAKKPKHQKKWEGYVTGTQPGSSSFNLQTNQGNLVVVTQNSTDFRNKYGPPQVAGLNGGAEVKVEGLRLDDGRILATKVDVRSRGRVPQNGYQPGQPGQPGRALTLTNLRGGTRVPANFNVQGICWPNSRIVIQLHSNSNGANYSFEGSSNNNGNFDVPARANNEPFGGSMNLRVEAFGPNGQSLGSRQVQLVRQ